MAKIARVFVLLSFVAFAQSEIAAARITASKAVVASKRDGNRLASCRHN